MEAYKAGQGSFTRLAAAMACLLAVFLGCVELYSWIQKPGDTSLIPGEAFSDLPIEIRHYGLLATLEDLGPVSQQALTKVMRVSATTVTQVVDELERLRLVERRRNPSDRRTYTVTMTPEGERVLAAGRQRAEEFAIEGDAELRRLLKKLVGV